MNKKQEQIKILIDENTEVFANAFLMVKPTAVQIEKSEQEFWGSSLCKRNSTATHIWNARKSIGN